MFVYFVCVWYPWRPEHGVASPGTKVADGLEPLCGCWDLD